MRNNEHTNTQLNKQVGKRDSAFPADTNDMFRVLRSKKIWDMKRELLEKPKPMQHIPNIKMASVVLRRGIHAIFSDI